MQRLHTLADNDQIQGEYENGENYTAPIVTSLLCFWLSHSAVSNTSLRTWDRRAVSKVRNSLAYKQARIVILREIHEDEYKPDLRCVQALIHAWELL